MMYFVSATPVGPLRLTDGSLARLVELTNQMTTPLVLRVGCRNLSANMRRPEGITLTFTAYYEKNEAMGILDELAHQLLDVGNVALASI